MGLRASDLPWTSIRMLLSMPSARNFSCAPCKLAGTSRMVSVCRVRSQQMTYTLLAFRAFPSRNHLPSEATVRSTEKVTSPPSTALTAFRGVFTASLGAAGWMALREKLGQVEGTASASPYPSYRGGLQSPHLPQWGS